MALVEVVGVAENGEIASVPGTLSVRLSEASLVERVTCFGPSGSYRFAAPEFPAPPVQGQHRTS